MKKGSIVKVKRDYEAIEDVSVLHTITAAIVLGKGQIGEVIEEEVIEEDGPQWWWVKFPLVNSIYLKVRMSEFELTEIKEKE
jgi:hypothetical protein